MNNKEETKQKHLKAFRDATENYGSGLDLIKSCPAIGWRGAYYLNGVDPDPFNFEEDNNLVEIQIEFEDEEIDIPDTRNDPDYFDVKTDLEFNPSTNKSYEELG